jgi:hypothetical protein
VSENITKEITEKEAKLLQALRDMIESGEDGKVTVYIEDGELKKVETQTVIKL